LKIQHVSLLFNLEKNDNFYGGVFLRQDGNLPKRKFTVKRIKLVFGNATASVKILKWWTIFNYNV